jgi:hypothetical protein
MVGAIEALAQNLRGVTPGFSGSINKPGDRLKCLEQRAENNVEEEQAVAH